MTTVDWTPPTRESLLEAAASFERMAAELRERADRLDAWAHENRERAEVTPSRTSE